ncbi:MAG: ATP synthase F1 subunit gamma, partial [Clostridiales bacterium]
MTNARDIKRRIKSVTSTQQITKAMKMVSAAKLRKSQAAVLAVRPFTAHIERIIRDIGKTGEPHPYLCPRQSIQKVCYLVIGSDRGQCGGFNANLQRFLDQQLQQEQCPVTVVTVGRKPREHCVACDYSIGSSYTALGDNPTFEQARELAHILTDGFDAEAYDKVYLVYSHFKSVLSQIPMIKQLLPVHYPHEYDTSQEPSEFIYEPSGRALLDVVVPQYVEIGIYCALQEAKASEHSARMAAMTA